MRKIFTAREKNIFYLTAAVFGFALVFNFLFVPVAARFDRLNQQINLSSAKLEKYSWLLAQKEYLQQAGSQEQALASPLEALEGLAKGAGITIVDLRPGAGAASVSRSGYRESLIDLRTEGAIEGYISFIYNLENSPSLLRVKSFQLSSRSNTAALEGNFTISQFSPAEK